MPTTHLDVSGMTCGSCVAHVPRALTAVPGVDHVDVSLAAGTADIRFDDTRASVATLSDAITAAGYTVGSAPRERASAGCCCGPKAKA